MNSFRKKSVAWFASPNILGLAWAKQFPHKQGADLLLAGLVAVLSGRVGDAVRSARVELERLGQLDLTRFPALQQRHLTHVDGVDIVDILTCCLAW